MSRFLSERFENLEVYVPGEQPQDMEYIKLNTNESPFPPSPLVLERTNSKELSKLRLYPDPDGILLRRSLADYYGVGVKNVFLSNGSDEILSFSFMAFCDKQHGIAFPDISYGFYKVYGDLYGVDCLKIPLREDFTVDCEQYCGIGRNIVIANPNAPTGMSISPEDVERILVSNPDNVVIIDEAYVDFGGKSCVGLTEKYDNLLVVQTFSKSRSLAGARLGFAIACESLIADLERIKYSTNPYNINRLTLVAGQAAVEDSEYFNKCCREIISTREYTTERLLAIGFEVLPSDTNFIFARLPGFNGTQLYRLLREQGVLVRNFSVNRISDYLRISIGTRSQMNIFLDKISSIIKAASES